MIRLFFIVILLSSLTSCIEKETKYKCANKKITIYTKENCGYCVKLKEVLEKNNVKYTEYEISRNYILTSWLYSSTGATTVPYIFVEDDYIGGYTDFVSECIS